MIWEYFVLVLILANPVLPMPSLQSFRGDRISTANFICDNWLNHFTNSGAVSMCQAFFSFFLFFYDLSLYFRVNGLRRGVQSYRKAIETLIKCRVCGFNKSIFILPIKELKNRQWCGKRKINQRCNPWPKGQTKARPRWRLYDRWSWVVFRRLGLKPPACSRWRLHFFFKGILIKVWWPIL